ncbi:hypothetical protein BDQ17DRAFT_1539848 [Cyathus striatus]|nr:hypothetical protein BDQ17DRAFT_1539848 [Cyathus striatus]
MPTDPSSVLFGDTTSLDVSLLGAVLGGVAYGIASTLYCVCCYLLIKLLKKDPRRKYYVLVTFVSVVWMCFTVTFISDIITLWGYLHNKNTGFLIDGVGFVGLFAAFLGIRAVDSLLVWRCFKVLRSHRRRYRILLGTLPVILIIAYTAFGIPALMRGSWARFARVEFHINLTLNITVTAIISIHLYLHERHLHAQFPDNQRLPISGIISMLIESAAIVVVFDLLFLIPFEMGSDLANLPLQLLGYIQAIAAFLTIFRVAQGKAWIHDDEIYTDSLTSFRAADPEAHSISASH